MAASYVLPSSEEIVATVDEWVGTMTHDDIYPPDDFKVIVPDVLKFLKTYIDLNRKITDCTSNLNTYAKEGNLEAQNEESTAQENRK